MSVKSEDLPSVYQRASIRSERYQKVYFRLVRWQIALSVMSATLTLLSKWVPLLAQAGAGTAGLAVLVALVIWLRKPDRLWHRNRALAEYGKSQAWLFMMGADPYSTALPALRAEEELGEALAVQTQRWPETKEMSVEARQSSQVTQAMRHVRSLALPERMQLFLELRAQDQRDYYSRNAAKSGVARDVWHSVLLLGQLAAVPVALVYTVRIMPFSWLGILTSIPAAVTTWLRARRHEDLAPSYAVAAKRLGELVGQAHLVTTVKEFSIYVTRVEDLLTREHEEWLIRRS